jgi:addiction module HigA family antidote
MATHRRPESRPPTHPGEILREEFMRPLGLSVAGLARKLGVPRPRISEIVNERRGVSTETALLLGRAFDTTPEFWLNAQRDRELWEALRGDAAEKLERVERIRS